MPADKTDPQQPTASPEAAALEGAGELSTEQLADAAGGFMKIEMHEVTVTSASPPPPPPPPPPKP